jgi:hypothetical protein
MEPDEKKKVLLQHPTPQQMCSGIEMVRDCPLDVLPVAKSFIRFISFSAKWVAVILLIGTPRNGMTVIRHVVVDGPVRTHHRSSRH